MHKTSQYKTANNNVRLLLDGRETFEAIKYALKNARQCINLEYFLISDDLTGSTIKDILIERASVGVNVRVLFDAVGSWRLGRSFIHELEAAGVNIRRFMPLTFRNLSKIIHRDHRKIITIDGKIGLLGGFNIGDIYLRQWRDTHLMLEGSAVKMLDKIFADMWCKSGGTDLESKRCHVDNEGIAQVKILASGTGKDYRAIADEYVRIISCAKHRVWITTPYLVPDKIFVNALSSAAAKGADVKIIIPSQSNHTLASWASQSYINELLLRGIRVFIYRDRFIHAKTLTADSYVASVGTANIDALSFGINYEVQAFVYCRQIVSELENTFLADLEHCTEETISARNTRPFLQKVKERTGRFLSRWL